MQSLPYLTFNLVKRKIIYITTHKVTPNSGITHSSYFIYASYTFIFVIFQFATTSPPTKAA